MVWAFSCVCYSVRVSNYLNVESVEVVVWSPLVTGARGSGGGRGAACRDTEPESLSGTEESNWPGFRIRYSKAQVSREYTLASPAATS